jgi:hypothetical protein
MERDLWEDPRKKKRLLQILEDIKKTVELARSQNDKFMGRGGSRFFQLRHLRCKNAEGREVMLNSIQHAYCIVLILE